MTFSPQENNIMKLFSEKVIVGSDSPYLTTEIMSPKNSKKRGI